MSARSDPASEGYVGRLAWPHEALAVGLVASIRLLLAESCADPSVVGRATAMAVLAGMCGAYSASQAALARRTADSAWEDSRPWSESIGAQEPPRSLLEGISRRTGDALAIEPGMLAAGGVTISAALDSLAASSPEPEDAADAIMGMSIRVRDRSGERSVPGHVSDIASDGIQAVVQGYRDHVGNQVGFRWVQVSAHAACAEDHLPYQGRVYPSYEFAEIQATLPRPFGTLNCRHIMTPCPDGSASSYPAEEVARMRRLSEERVDVHGRQMTRYQATQWQRRREARVRDLKSEAKVCDALGLTDRAADARRRAREMSADYRAVSDAVGLRADERKLRVSYIGGFERPRGLVR